MNKSQNTRVNILGVPVDVLDMQSAVGKVDDLVKHNGKAGYIVAMNPEKVHAVAHCNKLRAFAENASVIIPDGIGVVWAVRILEKRRAERVTGVDLMQNICAESARKGEKGYKFFIYGAEENVNKAAVEELQQRYPGIQIVGRSHGYVPSQDTDCLIDRINSSNADILFIALGSPRQEEWIAENAHRLTSVKLCQGVGGSLDAIVGHVKRAPNFAQKHNIEWLYRLVKQPTRIRRQWKLGWFGSKVLMEKLRGNRAGEQR